jgi:excisionase family DNA binding protein
MPKEAPFPITLPRLFTIQQIASHLQCSTKQVRRWIRRGVLTATPLGRHWRVAENDLALFLTRRSGKPSPPTSL